MPFELYQAWSTGHLPLIMPTTVSGSIPAFSPIVIASAATSMHPKIIELPISLSVGANGSLVLSQQFDGAPTFLEIEAEIDNFPSYGRHKEICDLFLRPIVARHAKDELRLVSSSWWPEYRTCY